MELAERAALAHGPDFIKDFENRGFGARRQTPYTLHGLGFGGTAIFPIRRRLSKEHSLYR